MKKLYKILLFTTIVFILNNCKERECDGYVESALWDSLPFKLHDTVSYINQRGEIRNIYIYKLKIFAVKDCDADDNCHCKTYIQFGLFDEYSIPDDYIYYLSAQIQDGIKITWITFLLNDLRVLYYYPKFETDTICFTKVNDTITVNNTFYSGVNIYEIDTIKNTNCHVWKVWVHKNYGIIKFSDRYDKIEWNLVR